LILDGTCPQSRSSQLSGAERELGKLKCRTTPLERLTKERWFGKILIRP